MSQSCDGAADIFRQGTRKARKPHQCDACFTESIRPGDTYTREDVLFEGRWAHTTRCARCQLIFEHLVDMCRAHGDSDEWPDPNLDCGHEYSERWEIEPPAWLAALAFWVPGDPLPHVNPCTLGLTHTVCGSPRWGGPYQRCKARALRWEEWPDRTPWGCS